MIEDEQVITPTGVTYLHKTKHGFTIVGRHTNAMPKSAEKLMKERPLKSSDGQ